MSLLKKVKKQAEDIKQEKNLESKKRLRGLVKGDRQVVSPYFPGKDVTESEILDYLKLKILEVAPLHSSLVSSRLERIDRDINAYCNGKCIFVGHRFFLQSKSYMLHTLLNYFGKMVTGMYRKFEFETSDVMYMDFVKLVHSITADKIINSLLLYDHQTLGMRQPISDLIDDEYCASQIFENTTTRKTPYIANFKSKTIQNEIERNCHELFEQFKNLNGNKEELISFTLTFTSIGDSVNITLQGDALISMYALKQNIDKVTDLQIQLQNLEMLRENLKQYKEMEEKVKSLSEQQDEQLPIKQSSISEEQINKYNHTQEIDEQQQDQPQLQQSQQQNKPQQTDEPQQLEHIDEPQQLEQNTKSIKGWDNLQEEQDEQPSPQQSNKQDIQSYLKSPLDNVSQQDQAQVMNELASALPYDTCMEWVQQCEQQKSGSVEQSFNILKDMLEQSGYNNDDIKQLLSSCETLSSNGELLDAFLDKFDLQRDKGLKDKLPTELQEELNELSSNLTEDEVTEWNSRIQQSSATSIEDFIETLFEMAEEDEEQDSLSLFDRICSSTQDEQQTYEPSSTSQPTAQYEQQYDDIVDELEQQYEHQLPPSITTPDIDEQHGVETDSLPSTELYKSQQVNTMSDNLLPIDSDPDKLDENIEALREELSNYMDMENINEILNGMPVISDGAVAEQTTSDVVDIVNSMNLSNMAGDNTDLLKSMSITNTIVTEYIEITKKWYKGLENFLKARKPNYNSSFERPNKKYVHAGTLLPSRRTAKLVSDITSMKVFCDSSGSMTAKDKKVLNGVLARGEKMFPSKTKAYEFNDCVRELNFANGKILDVLKGTGGTVISSIFPYMPKRDSGRCINIVISDGGFNWSQLEQFMKQRKSEIMVIILTSDRYTKELDLPKSRYKVINIEDTDVSVTKTSSIKAF